MIYNINIYRGIVLGFPDDFEEHFLAAWKEEFTGFELKWIEVEICRQAMIPTNVTDLFEKMKDKYPDLRDMHQSKFYRIVSSLTEDGYLQDKQDGRAKIIQTLPAGAKELGRISRYFFEIQMERFKSVLWKDLINKITANIGCLLEHEVVVLGPEYNTVNGLIMECKSCSAREKPADKTIEEYQPNFAFLNFNSITSGQTLSSSIYELREIDDWMFKDEYSDIVIMLNVIGIFPDKAVNILQEAKRVIGEDGKIVLFEMTQQDSKLMTTVMRESTMLLNYSNPLTEWELPEVMLSRGKISEILDKVGLQIVTEFPDVLSSIYIVN